MRNQKKSGFRKLSGMNKVSLNADKHEGRFMHRAMKSMPWLICASTAWLTLVPCEIAFADDPPVPDDKNVLYNKIGVDTGGTVDGGQLVIDQSVADKAVSGSKWYLTSNWAKTGNAIEGHTTIQSDVTIGNSSNKNQWFVSGSLASIGTATNSSVTATNATVYGDVFGGESVGGAHKNTVNIEGSIVSRILQGGHSDNKDTEKDSTSDNIVIVQNSHIGGVSLSNGTTSDGGLAGGLTLQGHAQRNKVFVTGSTIKPHSSGIYGGYTNNGNASENRIELNSSTVQSDADSQSSLTGGYAGSGTASFNTVILTGSAVNIAQGIVGGFTWSGVTSNNVVEVSGGNVKTPYVAGGYASYTGTANSNSVKISGSRDRDVESTVYGGYATNDASSNKVILSEGAVTGSLVGGYANEGTANSNSVTGTDSIVGGEVYGGQGTTGASSNTVDLDNVKVSGKVRGGDTKSGEASNNKVSLSNGTTFTGNLYAGYTDNGNATGNEVSLSVVSAPKDVYASYTAKGQANSSKVTGSDSKVGGDVYGGRGTTGASSNKVDLNNVQVSGTVRGGKTTSGGASGNQIILSNKTTFTGDLYAGYTENGNATGNEISLSGVSVPKDVYASFTKKGQAGGTVELSNNSSVTTSVYGGFTSDGVADGSEVAGSDSTVGGDVYGGQGTTGASSNTVDLNNVKVSGTVGGGKTTSGDASDNKVTLSNKTTFTGDLYAGYTENGNATGNEVSFSDVSAPKDVYASFTKEKGQAGGIDDDTRSKVTITESSVTGSVYGGYTKSGAANYSSVTIIDSTLENTDKGAAASSVYAGYTVSGEASHNQVTVSGATTSIQGDVYGGRTMSGAANYSSVTIFNSSINSSVYAGRTDDGESSYNLVTVSGSNASIQGRVYGGHGTLDSSHNIVELSEGAHVGDDVAGGHSTGNSSTNQNVLYNEVTASSGSRVENGLYGGVITEGRGTGTVQHNTVNLNNASAGYEVVGGGVLLDVPTGIVEENHVNISAGTVEGNVNGGAFHYYYGTGNSDIRNNTVILSKGTVVTKSEISPDRPGSVYGGYNLGIGDVTENKVFISGNSRVEGDVYGGLLDAQTGNVENNLVDISAGTVNGNVYGGAFDYSSGTDSGISDSLNNTVSLSEGTVVRGSVFGGYDSGIGDVTGNSVSVSDSSSVDGDVYGGMVKGNDDSNPGSASQNSVRIESGSTVGGSVYGGWNSNGETSGNFIYVDGTVSGGVTAGYTLSGDAAGNEVLVEGGTVLDHLYGGYTALGSATGNVITVKGGTVNAEMVGGYDDGTATYNTVTLYDSARFTGSDIYGGRNGGSSSDVFTGNTFNVYGQIDAASLQNFQNLNFYDVAEDKASVDLSRSAVIGDGKGSMTNVFIGNLRNQEGDIAEEYVLIHTPTASSSYTGTNLYVNGNTVVTIGPDGSYVPYSGTVANDGTMDNATGSTGMTKSQTLTKGFLTFEVDYFIKNGQDLIARWKKDAPVDVNPETEEFTASRQASAALMDEGADFVAGEGIDRALQASQCLPGEPCGAKAFVAVNGGYSTYKAGTTFDMSYGNMLAGIARQCKIGPVGYLAGVFFETGLSRFHSEYEPDDSRSIDSEGHDYYYGVGALAKVFLNRDLLKGLYAEGSIRYGLMMGDWQSHDIQSDGQTADWDGRAPYLTAHGGLGYMWDVTDNVTADVYAKYFWGHLWGDDGTICGQQFEFDDIYSSRVRTGARLNFKKDETFSWYLGGAWEHQFDSKSRGTIYGYDVPSTDLRGNTAIAEAGVFFKPAADSDFSFMLGTTGYFGEKREGVTGHLQVRYEF